MSDWIMGGAIVVGAVAISVVSYLLVRGRVSFLTLKENNEVAGFIYAVADVIYAVLQAFVVIVVWEQFDEADARATQEANQVADIYRDVDLFNDSVRVQMQSTLRRYVRTVIDDEWPLMANGNYSSRASAAYNDLWKIARSIQPATMRENTWLAELTERMNKLGDYRRLRLLSSRQSIPGVMWGLLIAGGIIIVAFTFLFGSENSIAPILMIGALAGMIALTLFLIFSLDRPFDGPVNVTLESFELMLSGLPLSSS